MKTTTEKSASLEETVTSHKAAESGVATDKRAKILIVDDDPVVRRIVLELLNTRYNVILAPTGVQLPDLLHKHTPNLVILDVMLPWVNGFELCRIIKTEFKGDSMPVLFLTGCKEKEDVQSGKDAGAAGYLTKPFYAKDLYREVERLLAA